MPTETSAATDAPNRWSARPLGIRLVMLSDPSLRRDGVVVRAGVRVHYQVFGEGRRTVLLLPSWSVVHSGFWAKQVPHLADRYTVIAFDGRGNGASDRPIGPDAYTDWEFAADALAVLDDAGADDAAVMSMSGGATSGLILAANSHERVCASIFIAPGLSLTPPYPERAAASAVFDEPQSSYDGWMKFNRRYWLEDWQGFLEFFSAKCFSEPDSAEEIRRWVDMGLQTSPEVILDTVDADGPDAEEQRRLIAALSHPVLVIHGTHDEVIPMARSEELARLTRGTLAVIENSGHEPQYRHAARVNAVLDAFLNEHYPPIGNPTSSKN
jgi:pimeloyl-ACP methyl ester carboxylesterase